MISLKHLYKNKVTLGLLCAAFFTLHSSLFTSCSDQFLEDKRPYGSFGPDEVYNDITSVKLRLNYLYQMSLPWTEGLGASNNNNNAPDLWPVGYPDILSNNTEEFGFTGYGRYCDPSKVVTYNENFDNFFYNGTNASPWKKMRECTDVIVRVGESTSLTEKIKRETEGQARFLRATRYFRLFKRFGGLPIITDIQSTLLRDTTNGIMGLGKVEKVYLDNPNLAYVLGEEASNIGNIRETFFLNQMRVHNRVLLSKKSDFEIDGLTFEIGGKNKGQKQIENIANGFVVKDDIEYGSGNVIPIWMFGLNY